MAASEPVKVSVVRLGEGVTSGDVDEPQDARAMANAAASHGGRVQVRFVMNEGSFKPPIISSVGPVWLTAGKEIVKHVNLRDHICRARSKVAA
jgi:hypothetical protein